VPLHRRSDPVEGDGFITIYPFSAGAPDGPAEGIDGTRPPPAVADAAGPDDAHGLPARG